MVADNIVNFLLSWGQEHFLVLFQFLVNLRFYCLNLLPKSLKHKKQIIIGISQALVQVKIIIIFVVIQILLEGYCECKIPTSSFQNRGDKKPAYSSIPI